ncbi:hypothetical protein [Streptomyces laurentii]|uniref:hypothetical protein n=1 Tax=Streptomyces laurentii TaxID=39478 RepID=UPI00340E936B
MPSDERRPSHDEYGEDRQPLEAGLGSAGGLGFHPAGSYGGDTPGMVLCAHEGYRADLTPSFTRGRLTAIEVRRFRDEGADLRVTLDGLDVFRTPSDDVPARLAERGHVVEEDDLGFEAVPELGVIFANHSSFGYPRDEEGFPIHSDYVLVTSDGLGPRGD